MKEYKSYFASAITEAEQIELDKFYKTVNLHPDQHYSWANLTQDKKHVFYIGRYKKKIVAYALINVSRLKHSITFGPVSSSRDFTLEAIKSIYNYSRDQNIGLLSVQLWEETSMNTDLLEYELYKELPFKQYFNSENWSSIKIDLSLTDEEIWKSIKSNHRSSIKKAIKAELQVKTITESTEIKKLADIFDKMYEDRQLKKEFENTNSIFQQINDENKLDSYILGVYLADNTLIGGIICVAVNQTIHYKFGMSNYEFRKHSILHLAIFNMISIARDNKYSWFDLCGYNHFVTKEDQVYSINLFKRSFGGVKTFYPKKMNFITNRFRFLFYKLAMYLYKKLN